MEKIVTENLFLLEFLVDGVNLDKKCGCDAPDGEGETCVSFQFLDNAPLDVCEADFNPKRNMKYPEKETLKSGKSCLFSLSPDQAKSCTEQFDLRVSVIKKMPSGWLPEKVDIGASIVSIANLFNELISSVELSDNGSSPAAKTLKDTFDINDSQQSVKIIGKIALYIRMSCFGKLIVTQFQMNLDDKSVLFKDKEGKSLYRYKKAGKKDGNNKSQEFNASCPQVPCGGGGGQVSSPSSAANKPSDGGGYQCPFGPCSGMATNPAAAASTPIPVNPQNNMMASNNFPQNYPQTPCNECGFLPNPVCMQNNNVPGPVTMMGGYSEIPQSSVAPADNGNYQEIGASMGGNSLTIRVHKDKGRAEQIDPNNNAIDDCPPCSALVPSSSPKMQQHQSFAMRPGAQGPNSPFSFRMGQAGDNANNNNNNVIVNPPVYTAQDGTQFTEFSDPNKETFILRIGKKSEGTDKKNNLELELQTPKGPPLKPIPKKETVETQWDPMDCGPDNASGGGKKGGKKNKKDKKKKK